MKSIGHTIELLPSSFSLWLIDTLSITHVPKHNHIQIYSPASFVSLFPLPLFASLLIPLQSSPFPTMQNNSREQLFKHTEKSEDLIKGMQFSKLEKNI